MNDRGKFTILVEKVIYRNPATSWTVIAASGNGEQFTACGILPQVSPQQTLDTTGKWQEHRRYGRQFAISSAYPSRSYTVDGIFKYLSSGKFKGIGKRTARKIVDTFGNDTMKILNHQSQKLFTVPKIPKQAIANMISKWEESRGEAEVLAALADLQIPLHLGHKILEKFENQALQEVQENPYRLPFEIIGLGFQTADRIGLSLGFAENSVVRMRGAIDYFLQNNERYGHCFMTGQQLVEELENNLQISLAQETARQNFTTALQEATDARHLVSDQVNRQTVYYRRVLYLAEVGVAQEVGRMVDRQPTEINIDGNLMAHDELSAEQKRAAENSFRHQLSVLTGAAGTGKTTTVKLIIDIAQDLELKFALCAPTGRAACRLKELTGVEAKTIHRLLEWQPHEKRFKRDDENPLHEEMFVVDEASMVDIRLARALFLALGAGARIVLVGDANQLPSVGAGNFLADLLKCSKVPAVSLSQIFRQHHNSQIISNAHLVIKGKQDGYLNGGDFIFNERPAEQIVELIKQYLVEFPKAQILSPIYRGPLGVDALNDAVKRWTHGKNYRPDLQRGDKVIQTVNNYNLDVYNGDIGHVVDITKKHLTVNFADRAVVYNSTDRRELKLAYAVSIHKSQGSEFATVIMPIVRQHYIMLNKNLLYTAITRAKEKMIVIGSAAMFKASAQRNYDLFRQTALTARIDQDDN